MQILSLIYFRMFKLESGSPSDDFECKFDEEYSDASSRFSTSKDVFKKTIKKKNLFQIIFQSQIKLPFELIQTMDNLKQWIFNANYLCEHGQ